MRGLLHELPVLAGHLTLAQGRRYVMKAVGKTIGRYQRDHDSSAKKIESLALWQEWCLYFMVRHDYSAIQETVRSKCKLMLSVMEQFSHDIKVEIEDMDVL
jgi:hypothetical protein